MIIHTPAGLDERTITAVYPDQTGKVARFCAPHDPDLKLTVIGWASVLHIDFAVSEQPRIAVEVVVLDPDFGPITASDLEHETGIRFLEIE